MCCFFGGEQSYQTGVGLHATASFPCVSYSHTCWCLQLKRVARPWLWGSNVPTFRAENVRASASSSAGDVAKLIKAVFGESPLPASLFTVGPEQDLKHGQLNELIADLTELDAFVTLRILEKAMVLQTILVPQHEAGLIAKPIRNLLQYVRGKAKNSSTGARLPAHIRKLVAILKEPVSYTHLTLPTKRIV